MVLNKLMVADTRQRTRRNSDSVIRKILEALRVLERISQAEVKSDFTEPYADLVGLMDKLGRRKDDMEFMEDICATLQSIAINLEHLFREKKRSKSSPQDGASV